MIKRYSVEVVCKITENELNNLSNFSPKLGINTYHSEDGLSIYSNSDRVSDGFRSTNIDSKPKQMCDSYLLQQEIGVTDTSLIEEFASNTKHKDNPKEFVEHYGSLLKHKDYTDVKENDFRVYFVKLLDDRVVTSLDNDFESTVNHTEEFMVLQEYPKYLEKLSDHLTLSYDNLLSLREGYYNIYPKNYSDSVGARLESNKLIGRSSKVTHIKSDVITSISGWSLTEMYVNPNTSYTAELTLESLNPIPDKSVFKQDAEYIVYKQGKNRKPLFLISSEGTEPDEEVKRLLNSHTEFLRPYFYLPNKASVSVDGVVYELINTQFDQLKADLNLPIYNHNL